MDAELSSTAPTAKSSGQSSNEKEIQPSTLASGSSDNLRRIRIALAEYAHHNGMHDPLDVLAFTQLCIRGATERLIAVDINDNDALFHEAIRVASESWGVCKHQNSDSKSTPAIANRDSQPSDAVQAASSLVARVSDPNVAAPTPEPNERTMPSQPLGELPDIRPANLWNSLMQAAWRPIGTLLSSMFVRSEQ
jgi:hypothetical protein